MRRDLSIARVAGVMMAAAAISISACASQTVSQVHPPQCKKKGQTNTNDCEVKIVFKAGCPDRADPVDFDIEKTRKISWQSVDEAGNPLSLGWRIYFDPFKGRPIKANNGYTQSPNFNRESPDVAYKYTIVGDGSACEPVDPRFRLR
ncbi:MAG: hypothetical protein KDI33_04820 [Halioglobus sp.]|nr:hypothetical protein [Halioglobus sp.]